MAAGSPRWQTEHLFGTRSEVEIEHRGAIYRLRITSLGKLILTK
ncbi:MAG: hemin uptake protein HemP [Proteobacteria bacterium]|nr:hemin uptake protein HemP [Pseudomonadota bacterium]